MLSLTGVKEGLRGHVVVEMSDLDNEPLVKLVGGELIETVVAHDVIGRLMIQCALQPGLAQVRPHNLSFAGTLINKIYDVAVNAKTTGTIEIHLFMRNSLALSSPSLVDAEETRKGVCSEKTTSKDTK